MKKFLYTLLFTVGLSLTALGQPTGLSGDNPVVTDPSTKAIKTPNTKLVFPVNYQTWWGSTNFFTVYTNSVWKFATSDGDGSGTDTDLLTVDFPGSLIKLPNLTASKVVFTDSSKRLTSTGTVGVDQGGTGGSTYSAGMVRSPGGTSALTTVSGTLNKVVKWGSSGTTLADSNITDDGVSVSVAPTGSGVLTVNGSFTSTGTTVSTFAANHGGLDYSTSSRRLRLFSGTADSSPSDILFYTGTSGASEQWRITDTGILQGNGAKTVQTSTGNLTLATAAGNGHILALPNGSGRFGIGSASFTPASMLEIATALSAGREMRMSYYAASADGGFITLQKSRNPTIAGHTIVQSGDNLGTVQFRGSDGSAFIEGAKIYAEVDGTPGANDMPTRLIFAVTADGASSVTEAMRITGSGNVGINTTTLNEKLNVEGTIRTQSGSNFSRFANNFLRADSSGTFFFDHNTVGQPFQWRVSSASALDTTAMALTSAGNLGIGTTTPNDFKLQVAGNIGPNADNSSDLGSTSKRVKTVHSYTFQTPVGTVQQQLNARAYEPGIFLDGSSSSRGFSTIANQNPGTGPITLYARLTIPTSNPSNHRGIIFLSDESGSVSSPSFGAELRSDGSIIATIGDGTLSDNLSLSGVVSEFGGQTIDLFVSRDGTTAKININGVERATETASGWAANLTASPLYLLVGINASSEVFVGKISRASAFNLALTESEVRDIIANGIPFKYRWGSHAEKITDSDDRNFATSGHNWTGAGATVSYDSTNQELDVSSTGTDGGAELAESRFGNFTTGKAYRWGFTIRNLASGTVKARLSVSTQVIASGLGNGTYTYPFTVNSNSDHLQLLGSANGTTFSIDDISFAQIGAFVDLDFSQGVGFQALDRSSNLLHGTLTSSGVTWTEPKRTAQVVKIGAASANGTVLAAGYTLPANAIINNIIVRETAGQALNDFYISTTAGSEATAITIKQNVSANQVQSLQIIDTISGGTSNEELFFNASNWGTGGKANITISYEVYD